MSLVVSALHIYPVKSGQGLALERAALDRFGLVGDRRFLVVDEAGVFLTQRTTPALAHLVVAPGPGTVTVRIPGAAPLEVPTGGPHASVRAVQVWRDTVSAVDLGPAVAGLLTTWLGRPARMVTLAPDFSRPMTKPVARPGDEVAFADAHPLLVITEASLEDLNSRLAAPVPMDRFRPNIVIRGAAPGDEDRWARIRIGGVVLRASGPCGRCVVTTTDQETLARGPEPMRTLATYRRGPGGEVNFGQNVIHETKGGEIAVGMAVEVLA